MLKKIILTSILTSLMLTAAPLVSAASPTPNPSASTSSASTTPSPTPNLTETTQRLKDRIEKIVGEKRDQIAGALDELAGQRRGFIGEVQRVSSETLTLKTNKGTQIIPLSATTSISKANKQIAVDDIAVGDWAIVIGSLQDDALVLDRLLISSASLRPRDQEIVLGTVTTITRTTVTAQPRSQEATVQFNIVRDTQYEDIEGNPIKVTDVKAEKQALIVGLNGDKGIDAQVIRILEPIANSADN